MPRRGQVEASSCSVRANSRELRPAPRIPLDLLLKRDRLRAAGLASYWIVDPDEPSVTVLELVDGVYAEAGRVRGDDALGVARPFPVRLVPAVLLV